MGMARTGISLRVVDEDMKPLPVGEVGEIIVRGETVMRGYWENAQASAGALRDGWLRTGDLGFLDVEGMLTLRDRSKDLIISGGSNIYPREVEEVLQSHPGVREVAVIGVPHPEWGEEPVAYVVMHAGHEPAADSLEQVCLENIARFKRPKRYVFVAELPKNNYGKILKTELRTWAAQEGDDRPSPVAPIGCPLASSPPDGLIGIAPPNSVAPLSANSPPSPGAQNPRFSDCISSPIAVASCTSQTSMSSGPPEFDTKSGFCLVPQNLVE